MAASYICDGCGKPVEKPKKVGFVIARDYCEKCAAKAKDFMDAQEVLLENARSNFLAGRATLVNTYGANNFKLPDVADGT